MAFTARDLDVLRDDTARNLRLEDEDLRDTGRALIKSERPGYKKGKMRGDDRYQWSIRPNVALRLNNDRFGVVIRDEVIVKAASDRWNDAAAEVVRALLKAVFNEKSRLNNHASTQATADEIEKNIPKGKVGLLQAGVSGFKSKVLADLIPIYLNTMSNVDNLDRESNPFLSLDPSGRAAFQVEFEAIAVKARANLLLDLVRGTLGGRGARVLAAVAKAHHITEQQVSKGSRKATRHPVLTSEGPRLCHDAPARGPIAAGGLAKPTPCRAVRDFQVPPSETTTHDFNI